MLPQIHTPIPGPRSQDLAARLRRVECRNTTFTSENWPIFWDRADGPNIWDADGNRFLDLTSAFGVSTLGHSATAEALRDQSRHLVHAMGDVHPAVLKTELCERLSQLTFERWTGTAGKTLLGNSGFEAVESALKTAVLATGRSGILAFTNGYHGLGYGALHGMGIPWFREPFEGQLANITTRIPFPRLGDEDSIRIFREALEGIDGSGIAAILAEPIQGRGGIVVPHAGFLAELRSWCDRHGALLILDEIYTGFHRTGPLFACEADGVVPDLLCLGKALSGGFPISACVGKAAVMDSWPESHGEALHTSTFLGNPIGCAMALEALKIHGDPATTAKATVAARLIGNALAPLVQSPLVREIRGRGLMWGIELRHPDGSPAGDVVVRLVTQLLKEGLILLPDAPEGNVLALTPPLGITAEEMAFVAERIRAALWPPVTPPPLSPACHSRSSGRSPRPPADP